MTTNSVSKFSLTIIAALVLAACGSSGSSKPNTNSTNTTPNNVQPAPAPAPAPAATDENHQDLSAALTADTAFTGAKHVVLKESNLITNQNPGKVSSKSDKPEVLQVQNPHESLDTIVVAETRDENHNLVADKPSFYLEDFDFRAADAAAATTGKKTLAHIYVGQDTTGTNSDARANGATDTKTATQGKATGEVFVYQTGRANYVDGYKGAVVDEKGKAVAAVDANKQRNLTGSVAEVYGYRTFAMGADSAAAQTDVKDVPEQANAPFLPKDYAQLKNVQYGRVTTQLSKQDVNKLKEGLPVGSFKTQVAGYGEYGKDGTENHYFYRGINPTTAADLAEVKANRLKDSKSVQLTYKGHALTYGSINHTPSGASLPTAIGASDQLIDGTHVKAVVDLNTNKVSGSLFNNWYVDGKAKPIDVVTFEGTVGKSGSMYGTSKNLTNSNSESGMFAATLYSKDATEMGGVVASDKHEPEDQWGAVFGAALTTETKPAPTIGIGTGGNRQ